MTPRELPDTLTPLSTPDAYAALREALRLYLGDWPSHEATCVLLAQSALETGHWRSCHCHNWGNVKHAPGDGRCWTFFRCNEIIGGRIVWFDPPNPGCCFRAFESAAEGAYDYVAFLIRCYPEAWVCAYHGDPVGFVRACKARGYFTADEGPYARAVASLFTGYVRDLVVPPAPLLSASERAEVLARVAVWATDVARERWVG